MIRFWKNIAFLPALIATSLTIQACSNSESIDNPANIIWQTRLIPCNTDIDGDIVYKSEHDEFFKCEEKKLIHVDIEVAPLDSQDFPTDTTTASKTITAADSKGCTEGDKRYMTFDSSYAQCKNGHWEPINEHWTIVPVSEQFLTVKQGKFIPNANFSTPFTLQPPQALFQGKVHCTFDGSEPDSTTNAITENITIDSTIVVRCYEFVGTEIKQKQTETYFINESINMPVVSISVNPAFVKDYLNAKSCEPNPCYKAKFWEDIEYPAHIEYFVNGKKAKEKDFEIDAGISIAGNVSRNQEKKSVSITMRNKYQSGKLHFPLFETRPENNKFKAFILRNNGQRFISDYFEDAMATSLLEGTNVDYQRSRQVIVFFNGMYFGIYDLREKLNEHFIETNYDIDANDIDLIKHSHNTIKLINGTDIEYQNMLSYIYSNTFEANNTAYDSIKKVLDIKNFIEYVAAEIYYHNGDWPQNNVRAWRKKKGQWKFIAFDIDHGFDWTKSMVEGFSQQTNLIEWLISGGRKDKVCGSRNDYKCFHNIFAKLIQNSDFKKKFINRSSYLYSNFINELKISEQINRINSEIDEQQIIRDQQRYKRPAYINSCGTNFDPYGECLKKWSKDRDQSVRNELRNYFKLGNDISITIVINGPGRLKLDGEYISPKKQYNWTVFSNHPIQLEAECYAGAKFQSWEDGTTTSNRTIIPKKDQTYIIECQ